MQTGDKIVAFAGKPVHSWNDLAAAIRGHPVGSEAVITVQRHGKLVDLRARLAAIKGRSGAFLGVSPAVVYQQLNPVQAIRYTGSFFGTVVSGSAAVITELPKAIPKLFAHNRASTAGGKVTSIVGAGNDTGQVIGADIGWQQKLSFVVLIIASLNVFVGHLQPAAAAPARWRAYRRRALRAGTRLRRAAARQARSGSRGYA